MITEVVQNFFRLLKSETYSEMIGSKLKFSRYVYIQDCFEHTFLKIVSITMRQNTF